jgi:hypothetical protein
MRPIFVLPAVLLPLAAAAAVAAVRQLTAAARSLRAELDALDALTGELTGLRAELDALVGRARTSRPRR